MSGEILLTGATGFLGMALLERYLEASERRIIALVRAPDDLAASERIGRTLAGLFGSRARHYAPRVHALAGDVTRPGLGLDCARRRDIAARVEQIIHSAASVSFDLPLEQARAINVEGTRRMLELAELARERGGLIRYAHVSTAYVAGTHDGRFRESDHAVGQAFRNSYEQSKFEAERLVRAAPVPSTILRPSIVVGDRRSGWTAAFNVLYWPLRAFARGLYPGAVPAITTAPVDVVPIDYVAEAIHSICESSAGVGETYHLTAGRHASTVGELIDAASSYFKLPAPRVMAPEEFGAYAQRLSGVQRAMLAQSAVYFPYFICGSEFDDRRARERLDPCGIDASPLPSYLGRLLDFATRTRWGKLPLSRFDALTA